MPEDPTPDTRRGNRKLLAMVKPYKPIAQMTPEELDEFVAKLAGLIGQRLADSMAEDDDGLGSRQ